MILGELDISKLIDLSKQVDYTSLDWLGFLVDMADAIPKLTPEWTDRSASDMGMVILELAAFGLDSLAYRCDVIANEAFLQTATLRSSVLNLARMIGYAPKPTASAVAELEFVIAVQPVDFVIPAGTRVSTQAVGDETPLVFETRENLSIPAGTVTGAVDAIEGTSVQEILGSSTGLPNQFFELSHRPLSYSPAAECSFEVFVAENGVESKWGLVDSLLDAAPHDKAYELDIDAHDIVTVSFGDGHNGRIPVSGADNIRARYRVGGGRKGNVGAGKLNRLISTMPEVASVTNPLSAVGGADRESVESIKSQAPRTLRTFWRAVTAEDYKTLAEGLPGVAKAAVVCASQGFQRFWGEINLFIAPDGGGLPTEGLKARALEFFMEREMLNAATAVMDPVYVNIDLAARVTALENYLRSDVEARTLAAVDGFFSFPHVDFGMSVFVSDVAALIDNIEGVDHVDLIVLERSMELDPPGPGAESYWFHAAGCSSVNNVMLDKCEIPKKGFLEIEVAGGII